MARLVGLKRQAAPSEELFCCLPGCGKGVHIFDPDQQLCFCGDHQSFTPRDVE